jgi:hypothetical protein
VTDSRIRSTGPFNVRGRVQDSSGIVHKAAHKLWQGLLGLFEFRSVHKAVHKLCPRLPGSFGANRAQCREHRDSDQDGIQSSAPGLGLIRTRLPGSYGIEWADQRRGRDRSINRKSFGLSVCILMEARDESSSHSVGARKQVRGRDRPSRHHKQIQGRGTKQQEQGIQIGGSTRGRGVSGFVDEVWGNGRLKDGSGRSKWAGLSSVRYQYCKVGQRFDIRGFGGSQEFLGIWGSGSWLTTRGHESKTVQGKLESSWGSRDPVQFNLNKRDHALGYMTSHHVNIPALRAVC